MERPYWFEHTWLTLSNGAYSRGNLFGNSWLAVLHDPDTGAALHLPCCEVFRTFYASSSRMARALLSGPWRSMMNEVVNPDPDRTDWIDGVSRIGLRAGIADIEAPFVHLLVHDAVGRMEANSIHSEILASRHAARAASDGGQTLVPLRPRLPFAIGRPFHVEVDGFAPYWRLPDHFIGLRIAGWHWPIDLPRIEVWRDNPGRAADGSRETIEGSTWGRRRQGWVRTRDGLPETDPDGDADVGVEEEILAMEGPTLRGGPLIVRVEPPRGPGRRGGPPPGADEGEEGLSFSRAIGGGHAIPANAVPISRAGGMDRFDAVADMLDRLEDAGRIEGWHPLRPEDRHAAPVGRWPGWAFPDINRRGDPFTNWHLIAPAGAGGDLRWRRAALVARVTTAGGDVLTIVTELRDGLGGRPSYESFCSATVRFEGQATGTVSDLLGLCIRGRGVWPPSGSAAWRVDGVLAGAKWRHCLSRDLLGHASFLASVRAVGI